MFKHYLNMDFAHFNDWREVLYFYCIQKKRNLKQTYKLYRRCIDEIGLDGEAGIETGRQHNVTILTRTIREAYMEFDNDDLFMDYMTNQKENFHEIRSTRRREIMSIISKIGGGDISKGKMLLASSLAGAFFESKADSDDIDCEVDLKNDNYFKDVLDGIADRKQNFSREFFILCLLVEGMNSVADIEATLSSQYIDYTGLDVSKIFDACVYEACAHHNPKITAFERFCDNTRIIEYKRPERFALKT
jgi:hypothetical protein